MSQSAPKMIYLTRRHPALTRAAFTIRWREHARLGMAMPRWNNVARYAHCDVDAPCGEEARFLGDHDGIGMIWYKSAAHRTAHAADAGSQSRMVRDEDDTFWRPIAMDRALVQEIRIEAPDSPSAWKITRFLASDAAVAPLNDAVGYICNARLPPENGAPWGLPFSRIEEFWFKSRTVAVSAARQAWRHRADLMVLSGQVELYRAVGGPIVRD